MKFPGLEVKIKDVQNVELKLLKEVDRFCEKHLIKYQISFGTLLGSVRHQGFIPWDDDIDIIMERSEYERFVSMWSNLNSNYFLQNHKLDPQSIFLFSKLRMNNTIFETRAYLGSKIHQGIGIDIFPYDKIPNSKRKIKLHRFFCNFWFLFTSSFDLSRCKYTDGHFALLKSIARTSMWLISKLAPRKFWFKRANKRIQKYNKYSELNNYSLLCNDLPPNELERSILSKKELNSLIKMKFEDEYFWGNKHYDTILTRIYGNYMELPLKEQQIPLHGVVRIEINN